MTTVERGSTLSAAINASRGARTFGSKSFVPTRAKNGGKIVGETTLRRVQEQRQGRTLGSLGGVSPSLGNQVLDLFRTKHTTPLYNDGLGDEDDFNMSLVINRRVKEIAPCFGSIDPNELAILYTLNPDNLNTSRCEGSEFTLQCNPLNIIPPAMFNYALFEIQEAESLRFPQLYRKRTPQEYWKDYIIDGIVEHVGPMQNRASVYESCGTLFDGTMIENPNASSQMATMLAKGVIKCVNYWGSAVKPGAHLYAILTKFPSGDYTHDYRQGTQILTNSRAKTQRMTATNDSLVNPLSPYQLAFFSLPNGGPVPTEYTQYYDEEGNLRTDPVIIRIGTVTCVPIGHVFREATCPLKPFTGVLPHCQMSNYSVYHDTATTFGNATNHPITIILNPDDGLRLF